MGKLDLKELYKGQISLSEWFEGMGHPRLEELRVEDNLKRERLGVIADVIGIPFDRPVSFAASELASSGALWTEYLDAHSNELCALRLIPLEGGLPKLRMRGDTVRGVYEGWFFEQDIDASKYQADVVPHCESYEWSTIFVVNDNGVFGEIVRGTHAQLTQGFFEDRAPYSFSFDWEEVAVFPEDDGAADAKAHVLEILEEIHVVDAGDRALLLERVQAEFSHDYLKGYFETVSSEEFGLWFIDYNRILGGIYSGFSSFVSGGTGDGGDTKTDDATIIGRSGGGGEVAGRVCVMSEATDDLRDGDILVCEMTTPEFLPAMQRASGVVTALGGVLSHAAITCRELGIPCVVGCGDGLAVLEDGCEVVVDGDGGVVRVVGG